MKNACANCVLPAHGNVGTTEQSPDEIPSGAEHDLGCPRSDYYPMSVEGTMTAAEIRVLWAALGAPSAAAPGMLTTVQGLRAALLAVFSHALNSFLSASTHGLGDSVDHK